MNFDLPGSDTVDRAKSSTRSDYIYESDTVRRAAPPPPAAMTNKSKEIPYHARKDSKPFTYGIVLNDTTNWVTPPVTSLLSVNQLNSPLIN